LFASSNITRTSVTVILRSCDLSVKINISFNEMITLSDKLVMVATL